MLCVISTGSGSELQFVAIQPVVALTSFNLAFVLHTVQLHLTMSFDEAYYYCLSPKKWQNWHMYMEDNKDGYVRGWNGDPGPQGYWQFTQIGLTDTYLVSSEEWPNWYMHMENNKEGSIRGWNGDPAPQGHWIATLKDTVTIGNEAVATYVFTTEKWPNWYIYMEDNKEGSIRGWNGDPGSQRYFIMKHVDPSKSYHRDHLNDIH